MFLFGMDGRGGFFRFIFFKRIRKVANFSIVFFGKKSLILFFDELIYSLLLTSIVKKKEIQTKKLLFG